MKYKYLAFVALSALFLTPLGSLTAETFTLTNTATISDANTGHSASTSFVVQLRELEENLLITKTVDRTQGIIGDTFLYRVEVENIGETTLADITIEDDFDEEKMEILPFSDPTCSADASRILCPVSRMAPGEKKSFSYGTEAIAEGSAQNIVQVMDIDLNILESANVSVVISAAEVTNLTLSSSCEGRKVTVGESCALTTRADWSDGENTDVSSEANYSGTEIIGSVSGSTLTVEKAGVATITVEFGGEVSNTIEIETVDQLSIGIDSEGKVIRHIPVRRQ